jgi:hypothetical protein
VFGSIIKSLESVNKYLAHVAAVFWAWKRRSSNGSRDKSSKVVRGTAASEDGYSLPVP